MLPLFDAQSLQFIDWITRGCSRRSDLVPEFIYPVTSALSVNSPVTDLTPISKDGYRIVALRLSGRWGVTQCLRGIVTRGRIPACRDPFLGENWDLWKVPFPRGE